MGIEEDEDLQEKIIEEGKTVILNTWDSGAPFAGADAERIYEYRGSFYFFGSDSLVLGPYTTLAEAMESGEMPFVTAATQVIESPTLSLDELMKVATIRLEQPHHVIVNGTRVRVDPDGGWQRA